MELVGSVQWIAFAVLSFVAVAGAVGMTTTMSMFRSGIFLMASFFGVAGLFILLEADLLGLLTVMMYLGGMLVMILFMVLFGSDPGGAMMTSHMKLPWLEKLFSAGLAHDRPAADTGGAAQGEHQGDGQGSEHGDGGGGHGDMSMFTELKRPAAVLALVIGGALVALIALRPAFGTSAARPASDSAAQIGELLMGKYMIAFEGAGLLILLGIFGAVYLQRPGRHPDPSARARLQAAVDAHPAPIEAAAEDSE